MTMQKLCAYVYIIIGFGLIFIFGGKLLLQIVGVLLGFMFIKKGFSILSSSMIIHAHFSNFKNDKF